MARRGIFPTKDAEFHTYINNAIPYMNVHRTRLQISPGNNSAQLAKLAEWNVLFPKTQDKTLRTTALTEEKNNLRDEIEDLMRSVFADIPESVLTDADRNTLNLKKRDPIPTAREKITTTPYPRMFPLKGGQVKITARVESDATRSSMHPEADSIEMRYTIGDTAPGSAGETTDKKVYKGAVNIFDFGQENATKRLYAFFRWKNESNESNSGPWSDMVQTVIA